MTQEFHYQPSEYEAEKASNSYLMSLVAIMAGLPLPVVNVLATFGYFLAVQKSTYFVRWHATQALLSQLILLPVNSTLFWWTISILLYEKEISNAYFAWLFSAIVFNVIEFVSTIYSAVATRKGEHVELWFIGGLTHLIVRKKMKQETFLQALALGAAFFALWFGLSKIDYLNYFRINQNKAGLEQKLGDLIWETITATETVVTDDSVAKPLEKLSGHLANASDIDDKNFHLHIVGNSEVNAFRFLTGGRQFGSRISFLSTYQLLAAEFAARKRFVLSTND